MRATKWLLLAATGLAAFGTPKHDGSACMTGRVPGLRPNLIVLATGRADTVRTGPGDVKYNVPSKADPSTIHGQLFRLDRVGGDVPAELAAARAAGSTEAVLVPYGYECRDTWRWTGSARWVRTGAQVMIGVALRPRAEWVRGIPTFDVDPGHDAYPGGTNWDPIDEEAPSLTPAQAFEMMAALPTYDEVERDAFQAYRPLFAWARLHPRLATTFPAAGEIEEARGNLEPCVHAYDPHPVAGTYATTVVIARRDTIHGFFRTDAHGYPRCNDLVPGTDLTAVRPRPADIAQLYVRAEATEADLESSRQCAYGTASIRNRRARATDSILWRTEFDYSVLAGCVAPDPRLRETSAALSRAYMAGDTVRELGTFTQKPDGSITFAQRWRIGGEVALEVTARRISPRTSP